MSVNIETGRHKGVIEPINEPFDAETLYVDGIAAASINKGVIKITFAQHISDNENILRSKNVINLVLVESNLRSLHQVLTRMVADIDSGEAR